MRQVSWALVVSVLLAGCASQAVFRDPQTGAIATCESVGPDHLLKDLYKLHQREKCIETMQGAGYERIGKP